jgi:hypothetical protein
MHNLCVVIIIAAAAAAAAVSTADMQIGSSALQGKAVHQMDSLWRLSLHKLYAAAAQNQARNQHFGDKPWRSETLLLLIYLQSVLHHHPACHS